MTNITTSKKLIKNTQNFFNIKHYAFSNRILNKKGTFYGWGRKKSGQKAVALSKKYYTNFRLLEDGFIRSIGLGVEGSPSFSIVEDNIGIYYDATTPSKLENILNSYDFDKSWLIHPWMNRGHLHSPKDKQQQNNDASFPNLPRNTT